LGDRLENLRSAVSDISAFATNLQVSALYESAPVGGPEQDPYLNAAVAFDSELEPVELLHRLQAIEASQGRERQVHWGPRTLDLDIIASDAGPFDGGPELIVPHPRAAGRLFVVKPMLDVWSDAQLVPGASLEDLHHEVADQDVDLVATTWVKDFGAKGRVLVLLQMILFVVIGILLVVDGTVPPGIGWVEVAGFSATVLGGVLAWRSAVALGRNLVPMPEPITGGSLVTEGPFGYVRHPIYTAIVLGFAGVSLLFNSRFAGLGTALLYLLFAHKSRYEEGLLRIAYPTYHAYVRRVRFRIPFLT
jgi:2-amino-4-hydroxy-6-hydroxymethyldihydropteridine diphosphokinase